MNAKPGFLLLILVVIIPPLGTFLRVGVSKHFFINIVLTLAGFYICGIVHGLWTIYNVPQFEFKSTSRILNNITSPGIKYKIKGVK